MLTLFLDTANIDEIKHINDLGIIEGVTTNQKIFLKSGIEYSKRAYEDRIREICSLINGTVSVELTMTSKDSEILVFEAEKLRSLSDKVAIKVPMWGSGRGLYVAKELMNRNIPVNMTCLMGFQQAVLAARLNVTYISLFYNRIADYLRNRIYAQNEIALTREYLDKVESPSQIIAGSIRNPLDVYECLNAGAHIVTVPYQHIIGLPFHPRTESTISEFDEAWNELTQNG